MFATARMLKFLLQWKQKMALKISTNDTSSSSSSVIYYEYIEYSYDNYQY